MNASPVAVVAPGQGAQAPRMLANWMRDPSLRELVESWSQVSGLDLVRFGTKAPAAVIVSTDVAQPLLVTAGLLALHLQPAEVLSGGSAQLLTSGHSIGELVAAVAAGVLRPEQAIRLATVRGRAMADACARSATGMTALLGGDADELSGLAQDRGLQVANRNATGQVVVAGALTELEDLELNVPHGVKVRPLQVAGAFHTSAMKPAQERFAAAVAREDFADPTCPWLSNSDGTALDSGADAARSLVHQLVSPVRWDLVTQEMTARGVATLVELPPAGTLTGIAKRELAGARTIAVNSPASLRRMSTMAA